MAEKKGKKIYLQVAVSTLDPDTREREFGAFASIDDNYPKYVLTLDDGVGDEENGVEKKFLLEFLESLRS